MSSGIPRCCAGCAATGGPGRDTAGERTTEGPGAGMAGAEVTVAGPVRTRLNSQSPPPTSSRRSSAIATSRPVREGDSGSSGGGFGMARSRSGPGSSSSAGPERLAAGAPVRPAPVVGSGLGASPGGTAGIVFPQFMQNLAPSGSAARQKGQNIQVGSASESQDGSATAAAILADGERLADVVLATEPGELAVRSGVFLVQVAAHSGQHAV